MRARGRLKWLLHSYFPGFTGWFRYYGTRVYFPRRALIFDLACEQGLYEADLTRTIQALVRPGTWYFDLGANIGLMSVPVLATRPDCHVLSFEPSPNALPFLERTRQESPWSSRWQIRGKAAAREPGQVEFAVGPTAVGGYDGMRHTERMQLERRVAIEATTVDAEWRALGSPDVSVIKLDIEGAELHALEGAQQTIAACRPSILLEWYEANFKWYGHEATDLLKFARDSGYELVVLPTLSPVTSPNILAVQLSLTSAFMLVPESKALPTPHG
jgi:FkbM family methyltransferase